MAKRLELCLQSTHSGALRLAWIVGGVGPALGLAAVALLRLVRLAGIWVAGIVHSMARWIAGVE